MNNIIVIIAALGIALGILVGFLISSLRRKKEPAPPQPGLVQEGVIWKTPEGKLVFQVRGKLFTAREWFNAIAKKTHNSPPAPTKNPQKPVPPAAESDPGPEETGSSKTETKTISIIQQVDNILQEKIARTDYADRGVRILEGPNQEMIIWVGLESYRSIDAVPDHRIRNVIREAVRAWEGQNISQD